MKWQYFRFVSNLEIPISASAIREIKEWGTNNSYIIIDGKNESDYTKELGEKGWELVSITPIKHSCPSTNLLLFYFKKQLE